MICAPSSNLSCFSVVILLWWEGSFEINRIRSPSLYLFITIILQKNECHSWMSLFRQKYRSMKIEVPLFIFAMKPLFLSCILHCIFLTRNLSKLTRNLYVAIILQARYNWFLKLLSFLWSNSKKLRTFSSTSFRKRVLRCVTILEWNHGHRRIILSKQSIVSLTPLYPNTRLMHEN